MSPADIIARGFAAILGPGTIEVDLSGEAPEVWYFGEYFTGEKVEGGWRFASDLGNSLFVPVPAVGPTVIESAAGWALPLSLCPPPTPATQRDLSGSLFFGLGDSPGLRRSI